MKMRPDAELAKSVLEQAVLKHASVVVVTQTSIHMQNGRGELEHMKFKGASPTPRVVIKEIGRMAGFKNMEKKSVLRSKISLRLNGRRRVIGFCFHPLIGNGPEKVTVFF